jgi:preprotein translocase subunit SecG
MATILLIVHLMIAAGLVAVVLLQRSEGGGLGTAGLAAAFFITSISLTLLARQGARPVSPLDAPISAPGSPAPQGGVLDSLEKGKQKLPSPPKSE